DENCLHHQDTRLGGSRQQLFSLTECVEGEKGNVAIGIAGIQLPQVEAGLQRFWEPLRVVPKGQPFEASAREAGDAGAALATARCRPWVLGSVPANADDSAPGAAQ